MPGPTFLDGDVVSLRTLEREDLDFCQEGVNDPAIRRGLAVGEPMSEPDEEAWFEAVVGGDDTHFVIAVNDRRVGTIGMSELDERVGRARIGYWIAPEHRGNGYATDAAATMVDYAFTERRLHKVYATVFEFSDGSRAVLEKLGFQQEGVFREQGYDDGEHVDLHRYGIVADEWDGPPAEP